MIVTPEHLIKQYFPDPIETTRDLYDRLGLDEYKYSYLDWLKDAEEHCLSNFVNDVDYKLLPDNEKNYWISQAVFGTLIQTSPSKICDQIRAGLIDITNKVATDRVFARQLRDQLDQEYGIKKVIPKVSKKLTSTYNKTGQDAFEFSVQDDTRLYIDIISSYNFQPGQKIKDVFFLFKLEVEKGVPYHIVDISLSLTNDHIFSYRTIWCCNQERQKYGAILRNRVIRVNLFEDNKKLVDSYEYILGPSEIKTLETELEKVIGMILDLNLDEVDLDQLGEKVLRRHNLNEQAFVQAIKAVIPTMPKDGVNAEMVDAAFLDAVDKYWKYYVLQPDPTEDFVDNLDQMIKERIPRVTLALIVANILNYGDLCDRYFKRSYSKKQKQALLSDGNLRLMYALSAATDFNPTAAPDQRVIDMCAFITDHLDLMKSLLTEVGQWPSN
ncbi:MAG: hypothetical protein ABFC94_03620 [Syntrophomonas sp.]